LHQESLPERYYSTKEFIFKGVPNVFKPKIPKSDNKFFDPSNTWYVYDNKPPKESLEKFAKFPISTSFGNNEPRLLLIAVDIQEGVPVVFDSYEKEDGTRKSGYERYGELGFDAQLEDQSSSNKWDFEHVIRYEDGIKSDFVLASCTVPVNYDYTRLNVENPKLATGGLNHENNTDKVGSDRSLSSSSYSNNSNLRFFWDGGLLANTPLRETIIAHRYYWSKVRKMHYDMPPLSIGIINLHPKKQEYVPCDYDGVVDRKNDIIHHDRTEFDEFVAVLVSDYQMLAKSLIKLAEDNGVSKESLQKILKQRTKTVIKPTTGPKRLLYDDLLETCLDVDITFRLERKNDTHTISNKTFDFSTATIRQLIQNGNEETKPQMKHILYDTEQ
jgi:hypothetical protein